VVAHEIEASTSSLRASLLPFRDPDDQTNSTSITATAMTTSAMKISGFIPSPVVLTMRPRREAMVGSTRAFLTALSRASVRGRSLTAEQVERRLAAVLAADVAGYSRLMVWPVDRLLHPQSGLRADIAPCPSHLLVFLRGQRLDFRDRFRAAG
jgi:hypothetical protein